MKKSIITTSGIAPASRSSHWHEAIANTYFPLELTFRDSGAFAGELKSWDLGLLSMSRLTSEALHYHRLPRHVAGEKDEEFLITVPSKSEVHFSQCGIDVRCNPGGFILQRSHEPYKFSHDEAADLWVIKINAQSLSSRIRAPDRFCSMQFDGTKGTGGLFIDMLHHIPMRYDTMSDDARLTVGQQLIDLLALSVQEDERTLTSGASSVRTAHLTRIENFVRGSLQDPNLNPEMIAEHCGISTRYLHELFRDTNHTLGQWIRDQRLAACREALSDPTNRQTIAEIAYGYGFSNQAQFSRSFRNLHNITPTAFRAQA